MRELEREREKIREAISGKNEKLAIKSEPSKKVKALDPATLKIGDPVKIVTMGMEGVVNSLPDNKGNIFVMCGALRTQTKVTNLIRIEEAPQTPILQSKGKVDIKNAKAYSIHSEINLLGKTVDEALMELDKYLDDAYLAHLSTVRVVHGKGTGTLREAVQRHLRKVKYVKELAKLLREQGVDVSTGAVGKWEVGASVPNAYQLCVLCSIFDHNILSDFISTKEHSELDDLNDIGKQKVHDYILDLVATNLYSAHRTRVDKKICMKALCYWS